MKNTYKIPYICQASNKRTVAVMIIAMVISSLSWNASNAQTANTSIPADEPCSALLSKNLKRGDRSLGVLQLQRILNIDPDTQVATVGLGAPGNESNYFGLKTYEAVMRFQKKYSKDILKPTNITKPTGMVGAYTRAKLIGVCSVVKDTGSLAPQDLVAAVRDGFNHFSKYYKSIWSRDSKGSSSGTISTGGGSSTGASSGVGNPSVGSVPTGSSSGGSTSSGGSSSGGSVSTGGLSGGSTSTGGSASSPAGSGSSSGGTVSNGGSSGTSTSTGGSSGSSSAAATASPVATTTSSNTSTTPVIPPSSSSSMKWGAYVGDGSSNLANFESLVGRSVNIQAIFIGFTDSFPSSYISSVGQQGKTLLIFWEPQTGYDSIISGSQDNAISQFASAAKSYGYPIILVPFNEMNLNEQAWGYGKNGNTALKFQTAWKHIHDLFAGAANVKFGLAYNNDSVPDVAGNKFADYYPGDAYVDYVGVDGFNFGNPWQTFAQVFDAAVGQASSFGKPVYIFSTASTAGSQKAVWISEGIGSHIKTYPSVTGWIWFNQNDANVPGSGDTINWTVNSDSASLQAFRSALP